jgi:hypothetical protein
MVCTAPTVAQAREGDDGLADVVVAADEVAVVRGDAQLRAHHPQPGLHSFGWQIAYVECRLAT